MILIQKNHETKQILSSDVNLDCQWHSLKGRGSLYSGHAIKADGAFASHLENVTVRNCLLDSSFYGVYYEYTDNSFIYNISLPGTGWHGVRLQDSNNNVVKNVNAEGGVIGYSVGSSDNNILENNSCKNA